MMVVILEESGDKQISEPKEKTKLLINFFKERMDFTDKEILMITESDAIEIENIMNQSKIFKKFNKSSERKLVQFA